MDLTTSLAGGVAGSAALTLINETARQVIPAAPRNDIIGERFIAKMMRAAGAKPPGRKALYGPSMAFDVIANGLYYGLAGLGDPENAPVRGAALGLAGGVANLVVSPMIGLGAAPVRRTAATAVMTVAWYTLGGYVAGLSIRALQRR